MRGPQEDYTTEMKFKEFVTFLLDKDGAFKEVKRNFNSSFYYMDDHWSSYYKEVFFNRMIFSKCKNSATVQHANSDLS